MYWITFRAGGKAYQRHGWFVSDHLAAAYFPKQIIDEFAADKQTVAWWRLETEHGRVILEG